MKFLDRTAEMARLMRLSDAKAGGLAVLWGRRRIGKSELLKEWCLRTDGLYTVADRSAPAVQRQNFAVALKLAHPNIATVRAFEGNEGNPFLVMDYIDGLTLDEYLAKKGKVYWRLRWIAMKIVAKV